MYLDFFSLSQLPFQLTPDTHFFYMSSQHEEVIDSLAYGIDQRLGFLVHTGEVGTGKTTTIRALLNRLPSTMETALIFNPLMSMEELLETIATDFGVPIVQRSLRGLLEALHQFLLQVNTQGRNAVVIIDEAQHLSFETMEMIRLLSNLETESSKLLQIVLAGQPELDHQLSQEAMRQVQQRIQMRFRLTPFTPVQVKDYINWRIRHAGIKACIVFEEKAYKRIHEYTGGIPRVINNLCDKCLMAAYVYDTHVVTKDIVGMAYLEMVGGGDPSARLSSVWRRLKFWAA